MGERRRAEQSAVTVHVVLLPSLWKRGRRETQEGKTLLMLSPLTMEMGDVFRSFIDEHFLLVVKWIILGKK